MVKRSHRMRWSTPLGAFVASYGTRELARELSVDRSTVYSWTSGRCAPSLLRAARIVELSRGTLTLQDLVAQYRRGRQDGSAEAP